VLGNGAIWSGDDAVRMLAETGCDGVVIGRGCLGKPWLFGELVDAFTGRPVASPKSFGEVAATMVEHAQLLVDWVGHEGQACRMFRRHAAWYCTGYPVGGRMRKALAQVGSLDELRTLLSETDAAATPVPGSESAVRGHSQGPQVVTLPEGWLRDRDDLADVLDTGDTHSGG
jgi:tRNA-dihydrouridine synthase